MDQRGSKVEETELIARRAQRGDDVAFGRLVRTIRPLILRWALVQAGSPDDAEDIAQAALLRLHRALPGFQFNARFTTWLFTIVRSAAADWRRARRRREQRHERYSLDIPTSQSASDELERDRLLMLVNAALEGLPARQREIFDLADLQGHAPREVAAMLNLNPSTVRVHLLRARRTIRSRVLARQATLVEDQ